MSLPLRLPNSSPAPRVREVLRAPVTPPPSPVATSDEEVGEETWVGAPRRDLSCSARTTVQGWAPARPSGTCYVPSSWPRAGPPGCPPAIAGSAPRAVSQCTARIPQPTGPALLSRRPSVPQGHRQVEERQPVLSETASSGGREPQPRQNSRIEWTCRSTGRRATPTPVPLHLASRGFSGHCTSPRKKCRKLVKLPSGSKDKYKENYKKIRIHKGVESPRRTVESQHERIPT
ncbi:synapsin-1-like [Dipodomys spectabilis]|uniref:synapsin-1-like n=1 Tax=Dipodomys spectabilis TaxID=105255 RepID=UPI001C54BE66|nr:synapsin-1-like [Dipodomys spectabilis]